ncbi:HD domain-containing phosphohydrolase [Arthrobacter sp. SDTb3-6]|uniref:HD domain-containing phosphohydrolase n=1 Tax=Arthrobacter sp. SDTb3-6 TaxID=2713571 RepID=UPI00159D7839|nr:HD domain-containing phosphohydrolase [Arthrobacter sp. SDTb3-6]NVM98135.1 hypothetical protein [Arthrobacter sp. SDTb3-6]
MLAARLGLTDGTRAALAIARDVEVIGRLGGREAVSVALREREGHSYDPDPAHAALANLANLANLDSLVEAARTKMPWDVALRREPQPHASVPAERLDEVLSVFADFADLKEPRRAGYSRDVAGLAAAAAPEHAELVRRVGPVQDLGRVAVPNRADHRGSSPADVERLRLHPYYSERFLARAPTTAPPARIAGLHHERLDGSCYYRGATGADIAWEARILATADTFRELILETPGPGTQVPAQAAAALARLAPQHLHADAVDAVLAADGFRARRGPPAWPAGLTEREVEVLRLICRGATKNGVAGALGISPNTADHHIRHIYAKIGVSSRAAATLFAVERDLL